MSELPSISLVVPTFNGAATLARTLESVLEQKYPRLELFVIDGGSTDGTLDIIKKYESRLTGWVSEKDRGQSHALNKGLAKCTGEIVNWLGHDDFLEPGALKIVGERFASEPDLSVLCGACHVHFTGEIQPDGKYREWTWTPKLSDVPLMPCCNPFPQPSCFFRRVLLKRQPVIDESYTFGMDLELWCYLKTQGAKFGVTDKILSHFTQGGGNKSSVGGEKILDERERIYKAYCNDSLTYWHRKYRHPLMRWRKQGEGWAAKRLSKNLLGLIDLGLAPFYGWARVKAMDWRDVV